MKNFVFVSPHFPDHFPKFIHALKEVGFRVLGIGDCPYDNLPKSLKEDLCEYYWCGNMDNFDSEIEAVRYFENKYGHIDYLESNNEYWLERDARLRTIFNIEGMKEDGIKTYQHKSMMKKCFSEAGVKVAKYCLVYDRETIENFIKEVGYPVFVKPDYGVGAEGDYKIKNNDDLEEFLAKKDPNAIYICEQFIPGIIVSYDGVADENSEVVFHTNDVFPPSIADIVNSKKDLCYHTLPGLYPGFEDIGPRVIKAFNVKQRFFHIEFFVLTDDVPGFAKKGEIVGLETNMRPAGGYTTDMINFANSLDCYHIYANVMMGNKVSIPEFEKFYCACGSRRDGVLYRRDERDIYERYNICASGRYADVLSGAMGNKYFMCKFKTIEEVESFYKFVTEKPDSSYQRHSKYMTGEDIDMFHEREQDNRSSSSDRICDTHIDGA